MNLFSALRVKKVGMHIFFVPFRLLLCNCRFTGETVLLALCRAIHENPIGMRCGLVEQLIFPK